MAEVVLVASSFLPRVGGVEEHVRHVARTLREDGVDVVIWTVDRGDAVPDRVDGVRVRVLSAPLPARSARSILSFAYRGPAAAWRWFQAFMMDRPEIIHVHCFGPNGVWASALAQIVGRPLAVTSHGETFGDADDVFGGSALLRWSLRRALRRARIVTACSAFTADDLVARFELEPRRARIVMNGVDVDEAPGADARAPQGRYVLALGRLVATKGFDLLIRAFAMADLPADVRLVIGGIGAEQDALQQLAREEGVAGRVRFPGRLSRADVAATIAGALALVVPSRVEPFGIVVLEGWRGAVPVIATSHGGPPEIIRDGEDGWIVDPFDLPGLAAALTQAVSEPEAAALVATAGHRRVREFSWGRIAEQYRHLYAPFVGTGRRRHPRG